MTLTALQYFGGCCHTLTWISHVCTCVTCILNPPSTSLSTPSSWVVPEHQFRVPCFTHQNCIGQLVYMVIHRFQCYSLIFSTLNFFHIVPSSVLYICASFAFLPIGLSSHLSKGLIYTLINFIGVSLLPYITLYNRLQFHAPHQNWLKYVLFNSWVISHCVYVSWLPYPITCQYTSRLPWCPTETVLQWTLKCMCLFQFCFPQCACLTRGLLGHMVVLVPVL